MPDPAPRDESPSGRRNLGLATCLLLGLTTIVGSGIYALPPILAGSLGPLSPLAFVAAAVVVSLIGLMTAEAAGTTSETGGAYQYARMAFGAPAGFGVAWLAWLNTILAWSGVSLALVKLLETLDPWFADATHARLLATASIVVLGFTNARGVKLGAAVSNALTVVKLVPLVAFVALGFAAFDASHFDGAGSQLAAAGLGGVAVATYRCIYPAGGFENIGIMAGEVRDPRRAIPKAVGLAILSSSTLYACVQLAAVASVPDLASVAPKDGPGSLALPIAAEQAATRLMSSGAGRVAFHFICLGAVVSMLGFCSGIALVSPRYLFAMARDRFVPGALVRTRPDGTPTVAIAVATCIAIAFVWSASWISMLDATVLFSLTQHATTTCAAWKLRRTVPREGRFIAPGGPLVPLAALASIAALCFFAFRPPEWLAGFWPRAVLAGDDAIETKHFGSLALAIAVGAVIALLSRFFSRAPRTRGAGR